MNRCPDKLIQNGPPRWDKFKKKTHVTRMLYGMKMKSESSLKIAILFLGDQLYNAIGEGISHIDQTTRGVVQVV